MSGSLSGSIVDEIVALGAELNANQYRLVRLAAAYDDAFEWFYQGYASPAIPIAHALEIHTSTAREWIRVGHCIEFLPEIDRAFRSNELSYAKTRILTRWADQDNEQDLLEIAAERSANRLTAAIAKYFDDDDNDEERDQRLHEERRVTMWTDGDGMVVIRAVLPPNIGKQVAAAIDSIVQQVARTPIDDREPAVAAPGADTATVDGDTPVETVAADSENADSGAGVVVSAGGPNAPADALRPHMVAETDSVSGQNPSAGASQALTMAAQLRELRQRWQPEDDGFWIPSLAQQRADAFVLLFLGTNIELVTEVVIHVRGDGATFDDGTPITNSAVCRRLDESFIRAMIHDCERRPINASNRRRHPTTRQKRVVLETHNHECVDCQSTDLLEFDHDPPYHQTGHTVTTELEPRCGPCHRARHRHED